MWSLWHWLRVLVIAASPFAVPFAADAQTSISEEAFVKDTVGCKDWDTWKKLGQMAAQGDREAFGRIILPAYSKGICRDFKAGDRAFLTETAILSGAICMRPKGETACFWVPIDSSRKP